MNINIELQKELKILKSYMVSEDKDAFRGQADDINRNFT